MTFNGNCSWSIFLETLASFAFKLSVSEYVSFSFFSDLQPIQLYSFFRIHSLYRLYHLHWLNNINNLNSLHSLNSLNSPNSLLILHSLLKKKYVMMFPEDISVTGECSCSTIIEAIDGRTWTNQQHINYD